MPKIRKSLSRKVSRRVSRKASRRVSRKASRRVSRKASRRVSRKASRRVSRKASRRVPRKASRRVTRKVSRRDSRKVSRRDSRKASRRVSRKLSGKEKKTIFTKDRIRNYLIDELKPYYIRVGNFIGEGIESKVYEGFDEKDNNKLYAIKYTKTNDLKLLEEHLYKKFNELKLKIKKDDHVISVVEYCGVSLEKSLKEDPEVIKIFEDPKKALELGLEALYKFHNLNIVHTDAKLDNICIRRDKNGKINLKLMDYGFSRFANINVRNAKEFIKKRYKDKYSTTNFYDLILEGLDTDHLILPGKNRNFYTGFYTAMAPHAGQTYGDDIEYYIWALYRYYILRSKKLNDSCFLLTDDSKKWLKIRTDPNNCQSLPVIFRDALIEIRKKQTITIEELCNKLKLNCDLR
jgi:hypothetical protein